MFNRELSPLGKLLAIILCLCFGFMLNTLAISLLYGYMQDGAAYKLLLILSSVLSFGLPALLAARFIGNGEPKFRFLGMTESPKPAKYILAFVFMLAIMPAIEFISSLNACYSFPDALKSVEEYFRNADSRAIQATQKALAADSLGGYLLNLIALAITPAICEEMFFRGVLQKYLCSTIKSKYFAILLTAIIFSAIHMQFSGLLPRFILGAILGYLFYSSGSLWLSIVAHATNNALVVSAVFFFNADISVTPDLSAYANPWWIGSIAVGLGIAVLVGRLIFGRKRYNKL